MMSEQISAAPEGYTSVAPWVVTDDTGAFLDYVSQAFDGTELGRVATEDGLIGHGEIRVGDTVVLAFDRRPDWPVMPSLLRVFVHDADAAFARAVEAGGTVVTPVASDAFGQRGGRIKDPFGNIWWVISHIEDVPEQEMWKRLQEPVYAAGMRVAQETLDAELSGGVRGRSSAPVRQPD
ncbi:VOC family protein [Actinomadura verrucosospora]|uniref:Glyoxalase/bleomycin resistance protein/dioxygenase n=1 Tax=Actinomadura verrucosospora TaxID=46165 RepID=A0A7D3ZL74_ACTVE|nr:VOC family protein [Actinomadura verrucosospora]QKG26877.1 Glyoxalase/bleomycin resistance protein/dioxygenase [Actinomadura verrucosospora]